jgi:hypothetical protein
VNHKTHREQLDTRVAVAVAATPSMRLRRWRLVAGRAVWLLIFTSFLSSYAVTLPSYLIAIEHPAPNNLALSRGAVAALVHVGISLPTYAWMCLVILVAGLLVSVTSSLVLFWRRGDDWTALVVSLFVAIHPVGIAGIALYSGSISALTIGWLPISVISVMESTLQFCVMLLFPSGRFVPRWS